MSEPTHPAAANMASTAPSGELSRDSVGAAGDATSFLRDLVALTKPRLSSLVLLTAGGGAWLAPGPVDLPRFFFAIVGTTLLVGAANAANCWLERDIDARMTRTAERPLPAGRLDPAWGIVVGAVLAVLGLPTLFLGVDALTATLGATALVTYVLLYTPLKRRSPHAVFVGTIPGAMPTLIGWTAMTGSIDPPGLVLFAILALWQVPHFLAIGIFRLDEYARAGFRIGPLVWGLRGTRWQAVLWAAVLVPVSLAPVAQGVAGPVYGVIAGLASLAYLAMAARPFDPEGDDDESGPRRWAKRLFLTSLLYVPFLFLGIFVDAG
ncbi:MAG TPA: heme o synthase [Polyangiaceae bacterium LLY-WYZ-14_1]|nr:heme o synthase [Polyangiaceae bacterium LLY-WYZ-14_1]